MKQVTLIALILAGASMACADRGSASDRLVEGPSTDERVADLFQSLLDGVQMMENSDATSKVDGPIDVKATPPSYEVAYEGCLPGHRHGTFCIEDGRQRIAIVAPQTHIIESLTQRYVFDGFASVDASTIDGSLVAKVSVAIDPDDKTTAVDGTARGTLEIAGPLSGSVEVDLVVSGGRNFEETTATPIRVEGTLLHGGKAYAVEGGFQRE